MPHAKLLLGASVLWAAILGILLGWFIGCTTTKPEDPNWPAVSMEEIRTLEKDAALARHVMGVMRQNDWLADDVFLAMKEEFDWHFVHYYAALTYLAEGNKVKTDHHVARARERLKKMAEVMIARHETF